MGALDEAGKNNLSFFDNPKYLKTYKMTRAAACFVSERYAEQAPDGTMVLISDNPYRSFALALTKFYPGALHPCTMGPDGSGYTNGVHTTAELEQGVILEPGVTIGPEAKIGRGTVICAGVRLGYRVCIGRDCYIGPNACITNTLIGDGVSLHAGVSLGQDGFGFAMGPGGHLKVPQIGRVIIQDASKLAATARSTAVL
jgi:UDP-3-O-[3-hydroxymyristoyl] glucosamine N-acyltransferase